MNGTKSAEYAAKDKIETILKNAFEEADKQSVTPPRDQMTLKTMVMVMLISGITAIAVVSTCLNVLK